MKVVYIFETKMTILVASVFLMLMIALAASFMYNRGLMDPHSPLPEPVMGGVHGEFSVHTEGQTSSSYSGVSVGTNPKK